MLDVDAEDRQHRYEHHAAAHTGQRADEAGYERHRRQQAKSNRTGRQHGKPILARADEAIVEQRARA